MNQAETLCHSSGPWKKHKYFQKIGEGANAVYKYAKDKADAKIQGEAVSKNHLIQDNPAGNKLLADQDREAYEEMKRREQYIKDNRGDALAFGHTPGEINKEEKKYANAANYFANEARKHGERATKQEIEGKKKSVFYKAERAAKSAKKSAEKVNAIAKEKVDRGQKKIDEILHPKTKVTIETKTFSGKGSKSKKVKTNPDGTKTTIETTTYQRKKK